METSIQPPDIHTNAFNKTSENFPANGFGNVVGNIKKNGAGPYPKIKPKTFYSVSYRSV